MFVVGRTLRSMLLDWRVKCCHDERERAFQITFARIGLQKPDAALVRYDERK